MRKYDYSLVMFDRDFDKKKDRSASGLETEVKERLEQNGWEGRCEAVVIDPELENWVWSGSACVGEILKWPGSTADLKSWLIDKGKWDPESTKPGDPKGAMGTAMKEKRVKKSSSLFKKIGERSSLKDCSDRAFLKFKKTLQLWFPPS
ncbi:MAG: hypothetical protein R6V10_09285 [bacterium]